MHSQTTEPAIEITQEAAGWRWRVGEGAPLATGAAPTLAAARNSAIMTRDLIAALKRQAEHLHCG